MFPRLAANSVRLSELIREVFTQICRENQDEHDEILTNEI